MLRLPRIAGSGSSKFLMYTNLNTQYLNLFLGAKVYEVLSGAVTMDIEDINIQAS